MFYCCFWSELPIEKGFEDTQRNLREYGSVILNFFIIRTILFDWRELLGWLVLGCSLPILQNYYSLLNKIFQNVSVVSSAEPRNCRKTLWNPDEHKDNTHKAQDVRAWEGEIQQNKLGGEFFFSLCTSVQSIHSWCLARFYLSL